MSLAEYARKRDFSRTGEPCPKSGTCGHHRFVIQKHVATNLHYDFRLELDGTLKSWAVPKGVPYAKGEKRLAMQVEDHPVSYIDFEGTIPKGQYGGGTVMVWDQGTFDILGKNELAKGKLHVVLHDTKLEGEWYLVQMKGGKAWLLIRGGDDLKPVSKRQDDTSALSGKSMADLGKGDRIWSSSSKASVAKTAAPEERTSQPVRTRKLAAKKSSWQPKFIEPMKAKLVAEAPKDEGWQYEVKFDGFRALAYKRGSEVRLLSRNQKDFAAKFPEVAEAVVDLKSEDCILDGEIVALDEKGRSSFQLLQAYELGQQRPPLLFYVFDLLRIGGKDLRKEPLEQRKARLERLLKKPPSLIRYSGPLPGPAPDLLRQVDKLGLEGLIGKRLGSTYESGSRSGSWIKLKLHHEQEFVIGGYTEPEGSRHHLGALIVGYYAAGKLRFAAKVGTGFSTKVLGSLHQMFQPLLQDACPFVNLPEAKTHRYGQAITAAEMKRCHWLRPTLVGQVRFAEWTRDAHLRQPVFLGLREDKDAKEVSREKAA